MKMVPKNYFTGNGKWDLKVVIKVGTLGFKRNEVYRAGKWGPDTEFWVDNDATLVEFYKIESGKSAPIISLSFPSFISLK